jgi:hypothetical protein
MSSGKLRRMPNREPDDDEKSVDPPGVMLPIRAKVANAGSISVAIANVCRSS